MRESQSMFAGLTNCAQASRSLPDALARLEVQPLAHLIALYRGTSVLTSPIKEERVFHVSH